MSNAVLVSLSGLLVSTGLLLLVRGAIRRPVPLSVALAEFDAPRRPALQFGSASTGGGVRWELGRRARSLLLGGGYDFTPLAADLRIMRTTEASLAFQKLGGAILGALLPIVMHAVLRLLAFAPAPWWPIVGAVVGLVVGFFYPDQRLREKATDARRAFQHALAAYLELVRSLIAGGMYVEGALLVAANAGDGPAFGELRHAVDVSNTTGTPVSAEFLRLGQDLAITELDQIASSISLAREQGVSPDDALSSRAQILSERQLYDARSEAEAATANMAFPSVLLALAFVCYLGAPALWSLITLTQPVGL